MGQRITAKQLLILLLLLAANAQAAITIVSSGSLGSNSGGTTLGIPVGTVLTVGSMGVVCVAADNAGTGGSVKNFGTASDTVGNTWTLQFDLIYDPGAANAGVEVGCWTAPITTQNSLSVTVNFLSSVTAKSGNLYKVTASGGNVVQYVSGTAKCDACTSGQTSGTPNIVTDTMNVGDGVIAVLGAESSAAVTGDADTTNGSWSSADTTQSGGTMLISSQFKVQTTTSSTQSYDPTLTSCDWQTAYVHLKEAAPMSASQKAGFFQMFSP